NLVTGSDRMPDGRSDVCFFFFSSRRRHTRFSRDWSSDVCSSDLRMKFDRILTHKFWGYIIFLFILLVIYGSIFELAAYPMDFVDGLFADLSSWIGATLPEGKLTELIADGIVPGLGGVLMFVPQIAILFFLISILEETGYMSRVVF